MRISFSSPSHNITPKLSYGSISNSNDNIKKLKNPNQVNKDTETSSLLNKSNENDILKNLMEQKSKLADSRKALIEKNIKNGDPSSLKDNLKEIDKQIEEINKQINKIQLEEQRKSLGIEEKNEKNENSKSHSNKTSKRDGNPQGSTEAADNLISLSSALSQAKALSCQKTLMSGEARVLSSEIKTDEARGLNPIKKRERLTTINDNIENISAKIGTNLKNVNNGNNDSIKDDNSIDANNSSNEPQIANDTLNINSTDKVLIKKQQIEQNIKHVSDNLENNLKEKGEKINITA